MNTIPILFDTDIGSDIDDAVALAYLLNQPRCELLGITTVSGEPDKRAAIADAVLRAAGRTEIPVHMGIEAPLIRSQNQPHAPHFAELSGHWPFTERPYEQTAIDFLRDTIRSRPGEITLLAVGPLTNIALLFKVAPDIPAKLKQLVIMGGQYFSRGYIDRSSITEWNIFCDPHAAKIVFDADIPNVIAAGLDVTRQVEMEPDDCRRRFTKAGAALAPVAAMAENWFRHRSVITFHDPLAAALIFEPSLCELASGRIDVDVQSALAFGTTTFADSPGGTHHAAYGVNADAFFTEYFGVVGG